MSPLSGIGPEDLEIRALRVFSADTGMLKHSAIAVDRLQSAPERRDYCTYDDVDRFSRESSCSLLLISIYIYIYLMG